MESVKFNNYRTILLLAVCVLFLGIYLSNSTIISGIYHWDFRLHYFSTKAYEAGLNPYNNADVNRVNNSGYSIPPYHIYAYHPLTFNYFRLFTKFKYVNAQKIYFVFNLLLIFYLIILWKKYFLKDEISILLFAVVWLFSFNNPIKWGLISANTVFFETAIIWTALAFLINNRPLPFLSLLAIISFFKGSPLALTPLIFMLHKNNKKIIQFVVVLLLFFIFFIWPYFSNPTLYSSYWNGVLNLKETGVTNPCSYSFIMDFFRAIGLEGSWNLINSIYALWVLLIAAVLYS